MGTLESQMYLHFKKLMNYSIIAEKDNIYFLNKKNMQP